MSLTMNRSRDRWIPWAFAGAMLLVFVVNAGMVFAALSTFTGVTVGKSYDRGRAYNQVLEEAARQDALGWRGDVRVAGNALALTVQDREGQGVAGRVQGVLRRPVEGNDIALEFEPGSRGNWQAALPALAPGQWEARLRVADAGGRHLDVVRRVMLP